MGKFIAVIGSGGKTTALTALGKMFPRKSVLLTTTTHILPVSQVPLLIDPSREALLDALSRPGVVCAGTGAESGKLSALSPALLAEAVRTADLTVCECDGSRHLPLKLHRPDEPVLPPHVDRCLLVAGLSALGHPVSQAVHRYDRNPTWALSPNTGVGVEEFLCCVEETAAASRLPRETLRILLNQEDTAPPEAVEELLHRLRNRGFLCTAASLRRDASFLNHWIK